MSHITKAGPRSLTGIQGVTQKEIDGMTYLRVNRRFLLQLNPSTAHQPDPSPSQPLPSIEGNLNVISAPLPHLQQFAGNTVDWLIRFAALALEGRGAGVLYTFRTQSVQYWLDKEMDDSWREVAAGEVLQPTIYEYRRVDKQATEPTRICNRQDKSVTTYSSRDEAHAFRTSLLTRHPTCIISDQARDSFVAASHLIPRRLGDIGVQAVFQRFTGISTPVTRYHASLGIPLNLYLDQLASTFQLGFWNIGNGRYQVHLFFEDGEDMGINMGIHGIDRTHPDDPLLHRYTITVGPEPPSGVFDWHYVQCVLKLFTTEEFRRLHNIAHFSFPFRTRDEDDSDWEFDDPRNIENPPYPSYLMDLAGMRAYKQVEEEESRQEVERWRSGIPRSI